MIKRFTELLTQTVETQLSILQKKAGIYKEEFTADKESKKIDILVLLPSNYIFVT